MNLKTRSNKLELLDQANIPFADVSLNMKELNTINTWSGGHRITIKALSNLIGKEKNITVCEIGCGGGDNLFALHKWCVNNKIIADFIGIDLKAECIIHAQKHQPKNFTCEWIVSDYEMVKFNKTPDVIFSSLFCHHFANEALPTQFNWMAKHAAIGFFINDLHRHWLAYYFIKWLTAVFSSSYLVKNDAPLSVARGFKKQELYKLLNHARLPNASVKWKWAFRYLILYSHAKQAL